MGVKMQAAMQAIMPISSIMGAGSQRMDGMAVRGNAPLATI
jgi:hypothetical protein